MHKTLLPNEMVSLFREKGHIKNTERDDYLFHEGDKVEGLYMVLSGEVKISKLSNDGNELTLRLAKAGDIVGELALVDDRAGYLLNAKVIETGQVALLDANTLKEELQNNGPLALELIQTMDEYSRRDQTRFRDLVMFGKKGALYSTLIRLSNSYGRHSEHDIFINARMTDQKLAEFCGTSRESINRLMSQLKKNFVLTTKKSYITIHNLDYLKEAINCAECPISLCTIH